MARDIPQTRQPEDPDLRPNRLAGQNVGERIDSELAAVMKELTQTFPDFTEDELVQIPIVREGARLEQGATYVDLKDPERKPFTARGDMQAASGAWLVPKADLPHEIWNRLIGYQ
jgi:hypothetical protein